MTKHLVLKPCGIDGTDYQPGDLAAVPPGSLDSAQRLGLIGPTIEEKPEEPAPKKKTANQ